MIKVFAFDLDGTLTQHRSILGDENRKILDKLSEGYRLLMVGAGNCKRIHGQMNSYPIDVIGNYGMEYAEYKNGNLEIIRSDTVECADKKSIEDKINLLRNKYGFLDYKGDGVEYHASGCITFPILGTKALIEDKLAFDPDRKRRRAIYSEVKEMFSEYNVFVGGSSSFDMAPKPYDKYTALDFWCKENGISHSELIFVGDDYGVGGNDESVYHSDFRFIAIDDYRRLSEVLAPWLDGSVPDVDALLGEVADCPCGIRHSCDINRVLIRNGAINELPAITADYNDILLVYDENTRSACGDRVEALLSDKITSCVLYSSDGFLVPNEEAVERLSAALTDKTDLILGVGSGVINDLAKYVSHERGLPYIIVATAPSMDGYASVGAAMIFGGMKITVSAHSPVAIVADTAVIKEAPLDMLKAGYGDVIGKYSCLNDWRLSNLINGEYLCERVYNMTLSAVNAVADSAEAILERDEKSIAALMRALVVVGIAMAYVGNSRPASGSEHHLSHYFEVVGLLRGEPYFCHGIDVAYSTLVTARLRRRLSAHAKPSVIPFDEVSWEKEIRRVYGVGDNLKTAEGIIALQKNLGWIYDDKSQIYIEKWEQIKKILADSPSPEEIEGMLCRIGLDLAEFESVYSEAKRADAVRFSKDLKDRYTVLWLYGDIIG